MPNEEPLKHQTPVISRIGGYLHKVVPIVDGTGKVIQHVITPLMVELRPRDLLQIVVGASLLAIPVGFTEEVWTMGRDLPMNNVLVLTAVSVLFISAFVYFNFYRGNMKGNTVNFIKRVAAIYLLSLIVVGGLLTLIEKCPWQEDYMLAIKRIIIVSFPASMSAAVADFMK